MRSPIREVHREIFAVLTSTVKEDVLGSVRRGEVHECIGQLVKLLCQSVHRVVESTPAVLLATRSAPPGLHSEHFVYVVQEKRFPRCAGATEQLTNAQQQLRE